MSKLKLGAILDDKPVKLTIEIPAAIHRDLIAYADVLSRETSTAIEPTKLIAAMLARFMTSDRAFAKARKTVSGALTIHTPEVGPGEHTEG